MTRIVFLDRDTIGPTVEITRPRFDHEWIEYGRTSPDEVVDRLHGADIAITNKVPIRREAFEQHPDLKLIAIAATGYDRFLSLELFREEHWARDPFEVTKEGMAKMRAVVRSNSRQLIASSSATWIPSAPSRA